MTKRSKKKLSQYVRDLIEREASMDQGDFEISKEIVRKSAESFFVVPLLSQNSLLQYRE